MGRERGCGEASHKMGRVAISDKPRSVKREIREKIDGSHRRHRRNSDQKKKRYSTFRTFSALARVCAKDDINEWGVGRSAVHAYGILDKKEKKKRWHATSCEDTSMSQRRYHICQCNSESGDKRRTLKKLRWHSASASTRQRSRDDAQAASSSSATTGTHFTLSIASCEP
jgi:hypothetical protein